MMEKFFIASLLVISSSFWSNVYAHQPLKTDPVEIGTLGGSSGFSIWAKCAKISVRTVSPTSPMKIYSNYPEHWRLEKNGNMTAVQESYFLRCSGALFFKKAQQEIFFCRGVKLFALPEAAREQLKKSLDGQFAVTGQEISRNGKPFATLTPTDMTLENSLPEQVFVDLPKGRGGALHIWGGKDIQLQMPDWQGADLFVEASGRSSVTLGNCKSSADAFIRQTERSAIKFESLQCHKLTIAAEDGIVDIAKGSADVGKVTIQAKKRGGSIKMSGDFPRLTTSVDGSGSIERL